MNDGHQSPEDYIKACKSADPVGFKLLNTEGVENETLIDEHCDEVAEIFQSNTQIEEIYENSDVCENSEYYENDHFEHQDISDDEIDLSDAGFLLHKTNEKLSATDHLDFDA